MIAQYLGWFFLPNWIAGAVHKGYYMLRRRPYNPRSLFIFRERRTIYISLIVAYLIWSIYQAYFTVRISSDPFENGMGIYSLLGVSPVVDGKTLKAIFRRLTIKYHPDKVGSSTSSKAAEDMWITLKTGFDIIENPVLRYGYDRLGTTVIDMLRNAGDDISKAGLGTVREVVLKGVKSATIYYGLSLLAAEVVAFFKISTIGRMWKLFIMICGLTAELWIMTRSMRSDGMLFLGLLPFQLIKLIRKVSIIVLLGINQLGPQFEVKPNVSQYEMTRLVKLVEQVSKEVEQAVVIERAPFLNQLPQLRKELVNTIVENTISNDLEVEDAIRSVSSSASASPKK